MTNLKKYLVTLVNDETTETLLVEAGSKGEAKEAALTQLKQYLISQGREGEVDNKWLVVKVMFSLLDN
jgi:hypothetical protein